MAVKIFTPEQLYDSLRQVLGTPNQADLPRRPGLNAVMAARLRNVTPRTQFVNFFKGDENADPTGVSSRDSPSAASDEFADCSTTPRCWHRSSIRQEAGGQSSIIFLGDAVSPTDHARTPAFTSRSFANTRTNRVSAYGDILWVLLNSSEFTLNH